jgi:hypothetical protein
VFPTGLHAPQHDPRDKAAHAHGGTSLAANGKPAAHRHSNCPERDFSLAAESVRCFYRQRRRKLLCDLRYFI